MLKLKTAKASKPEPVKIVEFTNLPVVVRVWPDTIAGGLDNEQWCGEAKMGGS